MKLYTVDRGCTLSEGLAVEPITDFANDPLVNNDIRAILTNFQDVLPHVQERFLNGLSRHGLQYFLEPAQEVSESNIFINRSWMIEAIFEFERLSLSEPPPSRFTSLFAFGDQITAERFAEDNRCPDGGHAPIYELESEDAIAYDMNLLAGFNIAQVQRQAVKYWQGEYSEKPIVEYLVPLPVTIGRQV